MSEWANSDCDTNAVTHWWSAHGYSEAGNGACGVQMEAASIFGARCKGRRNENQFVMSSRRPVSPSEEYAEYTPSS